MVLDMGGLFEGLRVIPGGVRVLLAIDNKRVIAGVAFPRAMAAVIGAA